MTAFDTLHEQMRRWVWLQGWENLRPIQENAIPEVIGADRDVVIGAPTAAGKTEAAYLPILSNLLSNQVGEGYAVLNISPLKALINDQHSRLQHMSADIDIPVTPWHGDVSMGRKLGSMSSPSGILIITPESLESLFVNRPHLLHRAFRNLRYVVIDELHAFMGGERGVQLQSQLSRLEHLIGRRVPRIALSATFANYASAVNFLRPNRGDYPAAVPDAGKGGHETLVLVKEFIAQGPEQFIDNVARDVYRNLRGSNNLVFANSRKEAEALAMTLTDYSERKGVPNEFMVHHGSLSKTSREHVEEILKKGDHPATAICTSTLELGIDIGKVKSIAQLERANSVSALRQRLGRSGRRGEPSILRIYSRDEKRDDYKFHLRTNLVQNIAVIELLGESKYEDVNLSVPHYSTLVQQLLSLTAQYGGFYPADAYSLLCAKGPFGNIAVPEFLDVIRAMDAKQFVAQTGTGQIVIGATGEKVVKALDFYTAFVTLKDMNVLDKSTGKVIGSVQYKPYVGEYIQLAARRWLVEAIDERSGQIEVNPANSDGKFMFEGFGQEIDGIISRKMKEIYESDDLYPYLDKNTGASEELQKARENFRALGLNGNDTVTIGGHRLYFTWGGMRENRTLALLRKWAGFDMPNFDPFAVRDLSAGQVLEMLRQCKLESHELATLMPRSQKETEKYDNILPEYLLDKKYAAQSLVPLEGLRPSHR